MSDVVPFPGTPFGPFIPSEQPIVDITKFYSEAFERIEGDIVDIDHMAEIARDLISNCRATGDDTQLHHLSLATFAVGQVAKMTAEFHKKYQALYDGEEVSP